MTLTENNWNEQDDRFRNDEIEHDRIATVDRNSGNDDDWNGDDDDLNEGNDDLDEVDTVGDDIDTDYDDDVMDDEEEAYEEEAMSREFVNDAHAADLPEKEEGGEMPEKEESENEDLEYPHETEVEQQDSGNDASYSEQTDVTPPRTKEFPSVGNSKTDFASRPQGRSTGRMLGHEPGTEGI